MKKHLLLFAILFSFLLPGQNQLDCNALSKTINNAATQNKDAVIMIEPKQISNNGESSGFTVHFGAIEFNIYITIQEITQKLCINENTVLKISFSDGKKIELKHINTSNCTGKLITLIGDDAKNFGLINPFRDSYIETLEVITNDDRKLVYVTHSESEYLHKAFNCVTNKMLGY